MLLLGVVGMGAFLLGRESGDSSPGSNAANSRVATGDFDYTVLNEISTILHNQYLKSENLDDRTLFEAAVNGMLAVLDDYGTGYMSPEDYFLDTRVTGSFDGIGVTISQENGEIVIVEPIKDKPADKAGIGPGDVITAVDGESTKGWTTEKAQLRIRGKGGTQVTITIRHPDGTSQDYKLTRATVEQPSVATLLPGQLTDENDKPINDIGYVRIYSFSVRTAQELDEALKNLSNAKTKGLIIDVRNNGGGVLRTAISSIDLLLDNGTIVIEREKDGRETEYTAKTGQLASGVPIVVLQNKYSASASEILSAALHDNGRGTIVGELSYGKGTVNTATTLSNGGALFVSTATWLTPQRQLIDHVGVHPDIEIIPTDEDIDQQIDRQLLKAVELLRGQIK